MIGGEQDRPQARTPSAKNVPAWVITNEGGVLGQDVEPPERLREGGRMWLASSDIHTKHDCVDQLG